MASGSPSSPPETEPASRSAIWARGRPERLAAADGAALPSWSPDSRWLAFFADGKMKKVEAAGGPVQVICDAHAGRGGTWGRDGTIVFAPDIHGPLVKVPSGGGTPAAVTRTTDPRVTHRNPWFLPDGRRFLFTARASVSAPSASIAIGSLDGGEPKVLLERGSNPQYSDGFLLTVIDGNLVAQRFDAARATLAGEALPIAAGLEHYDPRDLGQFSASGAGLVAYRQARLRRTLPVWLDRGGRERGAAGEPSFYHAARMGAGGRALALSRSDSAAQNADVWVLDLQRSQMTRATFVSARGSSINGAVSPDGAHLAVSVTALAGWTGPTLWTQPTLGSGSQRPLLENASLRVAQWSADGAHLIVDTQDAETGWDVAYVALGDSTKPIRITSSPFDEMAPALSPNGKWIVYQSNETGRSEVFVSDFPKGARKWQVSNSGGFRPTWRSDSRELYFAGPEGAMVAGVTDRSGALEIGAPERLPFPRDALDLALGIHSADGKRFLVLRYDSETSTEPIRLIRGWRRLVER